MATQFTLFGSPNSQFTYKVALMFALSGVPVSFRHISFRDRVNEEAWFKALSRWGQVPVLKHKDFVLVQSPAILEYLSEALGTFAAQDARDRHVVREWLYWNTDRPAWPVNASWGIYLGQQGRLTIFAAPEIEAYIRDRTERMFTQFEAHMPDSDFLMGSSPTIADICCYGEIPYARLCGYNLDQWAKVDAWSRRVEDLEGFVGPFELLPMHDAEISPTQPN